MSGEPIRFIHAADLHLEQSMSGMGSVPDSLRSSLIEAPFSAARRVFESARLERVDFVVLSGDILHPQEAGPAGLCFLIDQLEQLAAAQIPVYWAGGRIDRFHQWPKAAALPETVYRSASRDVRTHPFYRGGQVAALIHVTGYQGRGAIDPACLSGEAHAAPVIGVAYGDLKPVKLAKKPVNYWALGGRHQSVSEEFDGKLVHYPGTPQGRSPAEFGSHGCTLVEIDGESRIETQFIECDAVQWRRLEFRLTASTSRRKMERHIVELTKDLLAQQRNQPQLIQWAIGGTDRVSWTSPSVANEVLTMLRQRFESSSADLWVTGVEFIYPEEFPQPVLEKETIAGDFFEIVQQLRDGQAWPAVLREELSQYPLINDVIGSQVVQTKQDRETLLRLVARLGLNLLGAEESLPEQEAQQRQALREAS